MAGLDIVGNDGTEDNCPGSRALRGMPSMRLTSRWYQLISTILAWRNSAAIAALMDRRRKHSAKLCGGIFRHDPREYRHPTEDNSREAKARDTEEVVGD